MRRTCFLSILVAGLVSALLLSTAASAASTPRGTLTNAEYQELLAAERTVNHWRPGAKSPTQQARTVCKPLTGLSRLTETQRSMCLAEIPFFLDFFRFDAALKPCEKRSSTNALLSCAYRATNELYRATAAFVRVNGAATRAATDRGLTRKCLNYLVFTSSQRHAMNGLDARLHTFVRDLNQGRLKALAADGARVDSAIAATTKAVDVGGTVTVCRHL